MVGAENKKMVFDDPFRPLIIAYNVEESLEDKIGKLVGETGFKVTKRTVMLPDTKKSEQHY
ncbi:MAG: hypothetical protein FWE56_01970 [Candidatus Bathyarchaeota archaeon]|nr:hypothetical protein [Candidatus Termiticorpusculum sp.]MCL2868392.1 hypothetical protein [Candidatus Termiticorpusculum sp.]